MAAAAEATALRAGERERGRAGWLADSQRQAHDHDYLTHAIQIKR